MPGTYDFGDLTLAAATAERLSTLLIAEGYTGNFIGAFLEIDPQALADVYHGSSSAVDATVGRAFNGNIYTRQATAPRSCVDPSRIWLFSTGGGSVGVTFETF